MLDVLLNEDLWFPAATAIAVFAVVGLLFAKRGQPIPNATRVTSGLNLFYGFLIGIMAFGHLLGVTIKTFLGTIPSSTSPLFVFPLGFALAIPAWWLVATVRGLTRNRQAARLTAVRLNVWLGLVLLYPAWPLAGPAVINIAILTRTRTPSAHGE